MILLDTDHFSPLVFSASSGHSRLTAHMASSTDRDFAITVISVEEEFRGWMAKIKRLRDFYQEIPIYGQLIKLVAFLRNWEIVTFDRSAAEELEVLRRQKVRIGTHDLKIAAIALVHDALLLSANLKDFRKVPGLKVENWLK
jgi:tRNA(fMet)-specific endonuclease VapC